MNHKRLLRPERVRQIPPGFSWVDHRLVRHSLLRRCDHRAWALYLFLVTVSDAQGLSFYSDAGIGRHLGLDAAELSSAREQLVRADLLAYQKPLYQVLSLPENSGVAPDASPRAGQALSVGEILRRAMEGGGR